jgi:hypothetical protein
MVYKRIFSFTSLQLLEMPLITRDCTLAWDEMSIKPKYEILPSGEWCGLPTVPCKTTDIEVNDNVNHSASCEDNSDDESVISVNDLEINNFDETVEETLVEKDNVATSSINL